MNPIANVLDLELNGTGSPARNQYDIIEIGITQVNLESLTIMKTTSWAIWPQPRPLFKEIIDLTGWTDQKLQRQGRPLDKICSTIIHKYGGLNRMLIIDNHDELRSFYNAGYTSDPWTIGEAADTKTIPFQGQQLNVSDLFKIAMNRVHLRDLSLDDMLKEFGLEFEGRKHRADHDSKNIARLFIKLMAALRDSVDYGVTDGTK